MEEHKQYVTINPNHQLNKQKNNSCHRPLNHLHLHCSLDRHHENVLTSTVLRLVLNQLKHFVAQNATQIEIFRRRAILVFRDNSHKYLSIRMEQRYLRLLRQSSSINWLIKFSLLTAVVLYSLIQIVRHVLHICCAKRHVVQPYHSQNRLNVVTLVIKSSFKMIRNGYGVTVRISKR